MPKKSNIAATNPKWSSDKVDNFISISSKSLSNLSGDGRIKMFHNRKATCGMWDATLVSWDEEMLERCPLSVQAINPESWLEKG